MHRMPALGLSVSTELDEVSGRRLRGLLIVTTTGLHLGQMTFRAHQPLLGRSQFSSGLSSPTIGNFG
jgi:hypothetical protein